MNWKTLDLNLLRVLDAMLRERSTTRVAPLVGLSQPAVSAALNRLRHALSDPLFVREGSRMVPTPFAESLRQPLGEALAMISAALAGQPNVFDPSQSVGVFRFAGDDYLAEVMMPRLIDLFAERAPGIQFQLLSVSPLPIAQQFAAGSIDLAFTLANGAPPTWLDEAPALHAAVVVVASRDNRRLAEAGIKDRQTIPMALFCEMHHVLFAPEGNLAGREDAALAKVGRKRHVALTVPGFFSVARVVAQTHLIGLVPDRFALSVADRLGLSVYALPFAMPLIPLHLYWHKRQTADAQHGWIREHIFKLLEPLDAKSHPLALGRTRKHRRTGDRSVA